LIAKRAILPNVCTDCAGIAGAIGHKRLTNILFRKLPIENTDTQVGFGKSFDFAEFYETMEATAISQYRSAPSRHCFQRTAASGEYNIRSLIDFREIVLHSSDGGADYINV